MSIFEIVALSFIFFSMPAFMVLAVHVDKKNKKFS